MNCTRCHDPMVACCCHLRAPVRLVLDPSVAADDPLRVVEVLCDASDPDVEESFERVGERLRRVGGAS